MGIEKDTTFKFIGKNALEVLFELANLPESIDSSTFEEQTRELISLKISQFIPDFIAKNDKIYLMWEFESKHVDKSSKKRFHTYVALFDYEYNDEDLDIIFLVISTAEKSKVAEYNIGDTDNFKIIIFNIKELGFEEIINNACDKIKIQKSFNMTELVKLALTSLMPGTREGNIKQFKVLSDMIKNIVFEDEDAKISFGGLLLLLSNIYFDKEDPIRKKIQGDIMGKIDCIVEMREEQYNSGYDSGVDDGVLKVARNLLVNGFPIEMVCENTSLPLDKINGLLKEIRFSK